MYNRVRPEKSLPMTDNTQIAKANFYVKALERNAALRRHRFTYFEGESAISEVENGSPQMSGIINQTDDAVRMRFKRELCGNKWILEFRPVVEIGYYYTKKINNLLQVVLERIFGLFFVEMSPQHRNIYISTANEDQCQRQVRQQCQNTVFSICDQEKEEVSNAKHQCALHRVVPMHQGRDCKALSRTKKCGGIVWVTLLIERT